MKILHLTPGTGNFHCGSCLRDESLIKALRRRGHDAMMLPLYLPLVTDEEAPNPEMPVALGGVSLFLQHKFPLYRFAPKWLRRMIDSRKALMFAASKASMTSPKDLGELTLGSFAGVAGRQGAEWERLLEWIGSQPLPDIFCLSNGLLGGIAGALKERFGKPVICHLQGEDAFVETLPEPYRSQVWDAFRATAEHIDLFIATSDYYAATMRQHLRLGEDHLARLWNGIPAEHYSPAKEPPPGPPAIGFLARLIEGKGLTQIVEAFIALRARSGAPKARLRIGGSAVPSDKGYHDSLRAMIAKAGLESEVDWCPNLTLAEKVAFFQSLTVFSVPATYGEAFGLYVAEAMACGIPCVKPHHGGFPEIIEATGGGILVEPDDTKALADGLQRMLEDGDLRQACAQRAAENAPKLFSADAMAEGFEELLKARGIGAAAAG